MNELLGRSWLRCGRFGYTPKATYPKATPLPQGLPQWRTLWDALPAALGSRGHHQASHIQSRPIRRGVLTRANSFEVEEVLPARLSDSPYTNAKERFPVRPNA